LVGPGGIGKTTVAVKAAHQLRDEFDGEIRFFNLGVITDPALVHVTIASMLGVSTSFGNPVSAIVAFFSRRKTLLVLDSCEHVVEPVAELSDAVFQKTADTHILTTTREALRVEGEHAVRLATLDCPPEDCCSTAAESLAYPAVELFVERACANASGFKLTDENAPTVSEICRKLDGLALAIELAAGRVEAYGLIEIARLLDSRLGLLWQGRRTAPTRHQTLQAMLDWSYELLSEAEQTVLVRLAVFNDSFTLEAARAVAGHAETEQFDVVEIVASLVAKSLVSSLAGHARQRYRLLDTTRTYAREKLAANEDQRDVARRHALFFVSVLEELERPDDRSSSTSFLDSINDIRSALHWSFHNGETAIGIALAAAAASLFLEHSLLGECLRWTKLAIQSLGDGDRGSGTELELQTSFGWAALFASGEGEATQGAFLRGLQIADSDPDPNLQLRLLGGLNIIRTRAGDYIGALELAERGEAIARQTSDAAVMALANWTLGVCHHLCGHHALAVEYCESAVRMPTRSPYVRKIADYGFDHRGRALIARARSLWLLGYPDRAVAAGHLAIKAADELGHPISLCIALLYSSTVFLWAERWAEADAAIDRLISHAGTHSLMYKGVGLALREMSGVRQKHDSASIDRLRLSVDSLVRDRHLILVPMCRITIAQALLASGEPSEALAVITAALEDLGPVKDCVDGPELLRVQGRVLAALGQWSEAEEALRGAIDLAVQQSALSWQLRAAMSLAELRAERGDPDAPAILRPIVDRFTEGFETGDLPVALKMLGDRARG